MQSKTKVALVTGGARGIGLGIALKLAEAGFTLVISGRRAHDQVQSALDQLKQHSAASIYVQADVASGADRARLLLLWKKLWQAGCSGQQCGNCTARPRRYSRGTRREFRRTHRDQPEGTLFPDTSVASWMIRQQSGGAALHRAIINISSVSATVASVNRGDYCISKAGIAMATRLWAVRLAEYGIGVYEVRPGIIETDMTAGVTRSTTR